MRDPKRGGVGLAAIAAVGGVTAAQAGGSPASSAPSADATAAPVRTASAAAGGSTEAILVNAQTAVGSTPGSLDPTFGNGGKVLTPGGGATDAILQPNGDIVVSGGFGVARQLATGKLDSTFGTGGLASAGFVGGRAARASPSSLTERSSGSAARATPASRPAGPSSSRQPGSTPTAAWTPASAPAAGPARSSSPRRCRAPRSSPTRCWFSRTERSWYPARPGRADQIRFAPIQGALARFNANGTLDSSFGIGGKILSSSLDGITALGLDAAGNIFTLPTRAEFSPSGQADASVSPATITASSHGGSSVFLPSGQFVQANGVTVARYDDDVQVQRSNADGSIASASSAFDYSGAADLDQARDSAGAVALQANGQAVAGGAHFFGTSLFGLARVNADGTLDAGFGSGGVLTTTFNGNEAVQAVLIQPDGKIIAVGNSQDNATGQSFIVLARYNP